MTTATKTLSQQALDFIAKQDKPVKTIILTKHFGRKMGDLVQKLWIKNQVNRIRVADGRWEYFISNNDGENAVAHKKHQSEKSKTSLIFEHLRKVNKPQTTKNIQDALGLNRVGNLLSVLHFHKRLKRISRKQTANDQARFAYYIADREEDNTVIKNVEIEKPTVHKEELSVEATDAVLQIEEQIVRQPTVQKEKLVAKTSGNLLSFHDIMNDIDTARTRLQSAETKMQNFEDRLERTIKEAISSLAKLLRSDSCGDSGNLGED